jgi:hypothetical protein
MKLTVAVDAKGEVASTIRGHAAEHTDAGYVPNPKYNYHELDVPDEYEQIEDAEEFHKKVVSHLPS